MLIDKKDLRLDNNGMENKVDNTSNVAFNPAAVSPVDPVGEELPILGPGSVDAIKGIDKPDAKKMLHGQLNKIISFLKNEGDQSL